jgi:hypothetical protein
MDAGGRGVVAATYLNLDVDHNGMLSKREFMRYGGGSLTTVFVDRLFQEYRMYESGETGEMEMVSAALRFFSALLCGWHSPVAGFCWL